MKGPKEYWLDKLMRLHAAGGKDAPTQLYQVAHGSRLYGLNHADSDVDLWQVWDKLPAGMSGKRNTHDRVDLMVLSLPHFLDLVHRGAPQALEAMFAPKQPIDMLWHYRRAYRANSLVATSVYQSAIHRFEASPVPKVRRHAARLEFDLHHLHAHGRFDPQLFATTDLADINLYT